MYVLGLGHQGHVTRYTSVGAMFTTWCYYFNVALGVTTLGLGVNTIFRLVV